jgi:hypothetical protein
MPFVLKNEKGEYLKGRSSWNMEMTSDLLQARVYPTSGAANNSRNRTPRYGGKPTWGHLKVQPITIMEVSE